MKATKTMTLIEDGFAARNSARPDLYPHAPQANGASGTPPAEPPNELSPGPVFNRIEEGLSVRAGHLDDGAMHRPSAPAAVPGPQPDETGPAVRGPAVETPPALKPAGTQFAPIAAAKS